MLMWGMRAETQALEVHQHTLFRHLKYAFFSRNLGQNMPKNAYFLEKRLKNHRSAQGRCPRTSVSLRQLGTPPPDLRVVTPTY